MVIESLVKRMHDRSNIEDHRNKLNAYLSENNLTAAGSDIRSLLAIALEATHGEYLYTGLAATGLGRSITFLKGEWLKVCKELRIPHSSQEGVESLVEKVRSFGFNKIKSVDERVNIASIVVECPAQAAAEENT